MEINEDHIRIGHSFVESGRLDDASLKRAIRIAETENQPLDTILCKLGFVSEIELAAEFGRVLGLSVVDEADMPDMPLDISGLSPRFLQEHRVLPVERGADGVVLAMADPSNRFVTNAFQLAAGTISEVRVGPPALIEKVIARLYGDAIDEGEAQGDGEADGAHDVDVERLRDLASDAPVVRFVNRLISEAVELKASDIHVEPDETASHVRFRVDGVLQPGPVVPDGMTAAVISRLKILARLDISERRHPQDGRVQTVVRGNQVDIRVATLPTVTGESLVMRVLDRSSVRLDHKALGIREPVLGVVRRAEKLNHGIVLVTGPTGSGKSTTLYTMLSAINDNTQKILTVEDPVEVQISGINQVQVRSEIGLGFASVLRSMLRNDPDVLMVGEIRDGETARIAAQAALTGHLVLSTLHTNDASSAITRLLDMGVEPYLLTAALSAVVGQRLVRRLCPNCRTPYEPSAELLASLGLSAEPGLTFHRANGCDACGARGYTGRTVVMEAFEMNDRLRQLILGNAGVDAIRAEAEQAGMRPMFQDGIALARAGETSVEEILRVTRAGR